MIDLRDRQIPVSFNVMRSDSGPKPAPAFGKIVGFSDTIELGKKEAKSRRSEVRLNTGDVRWLKGARTAYGAEIRVVDISSNGILIESDQELAANSTIALELLGVNESFRVPARVLRCKRFYQGDIVWYQAACRFKRPVELNAIR